MPALHTFAPAPSLDAHRQAISARVLDVIGASVGLLLFFPLMLIVSTAIILERRGPVLFAHERIGFDGRMFRVLKFRSMCVNGEELLRQYLQLHPAAAAEWAADHKLRCDPRITPLGSLLRKSSLDELPQLINVLRGEMSLVGPRPIVAEEARRYGRFLNSYCSVKPGITGVWQISGRNDVSYKRKIAMDALYAKRKSLTLDLGIIFATIPAVLTRRGSY